MDIKQFEAQNSMKKIVHINSYRPRLQLNCIYNIVNCYDIMKKGDNKSKQEITRDNARKHAKIQYFKNVRKKCCKYNNLKNSNYYYYS